MTDSTFQTRLPLMTDKEMLELAKRLAPHRWYWIADMENRAKDAKIKPALHNLRTRAYHLDEGDW